MAEDWAKTFATNKSPRKPETIPFDLNDSDYDMRQPDYNLKSHVDSSQSKLMK
jgi:hypothetical protein